MFAQLLVGLGLATYAALLSGVAYQIRASKNNAAATARLLEAIKDTLTEQRHWNMRQAEWNEQTSRGIHQLTEDVEQIEEVTVRHSNRLRDDGRRLRDLEKRLDAHDTWREAVQRDARMAYLQQQPRPTTEGRPDE